MLGFCPECGTKVSSHALACPYCGCKIRARKLVKSGDERLPAILTDSGLVSTDCFDLMPVNINQDKQLTNAFCVAQNLATVAPVLFEAVKSLIPSKLPAQVVKVAKITKEVQKLLDKGAVKFGIDKNGETLPYVQDLKTGEIVKQVRLEDTELSPDKGSPISFLFIQSSLARIIFSIDDLKRNVAGLYQELQNDRFALADSVWQQFRQAGAITDSRLRNEMILSILGRATDAKCQLIRSFLSKKANLDAALDKSWWRKAIDLFKKGQEKENVEVFFADLLAITRMVQIEATSFFVLEEKNAVQECLLQFKSFVSNNGLYDENILAKMDSVSKNDHGAIIELFTSTVRRIDQYLPVEREPVLPAAEADAEECTASPVLTG